MSNMLRVLVGLEGGNWFLDVPYTLGVAVARTAPLLILHVFLQYLRSSLSIELHLSKSALALCRIQPCFSCRIKIKRVRTSYTYILKYCICLEIHGT